MTGGNRFFGKTERQQYREHEGDWELHHPVEPPRLNDPPAPVKTCGGCDFHKVNRCWVLGVHFPSKVNSDDEACCKWEGSE